MVRFLDVRRGETGPLVRLAVLFVLLMAAHTALETARDTLLITHMPSKYIGVVYVAVAAATLPATFVVSRALQRFGGLRTYRVGVAFIAAILIMLCAASVTRASVIALYVMSTLIGATLVPLVWNLVGGTFTVSQGRRLLAPITASAGAGAVVGSAAAASAISIVHAKLIIAATAIVLVTTIFLSQGGTREPVSAEPTKSPPTDPFIRRIALLVVASSAAAVIIDYLFKTTIARAIAPHDVGRVVGRYYFVMNSLTIIAQLAVSGTIVRRFGMTRSLVITPAVLFTASLAVVATRGALAVVLITRALDGTLRNSLHRLTMELAYIPVPQAARARAKPIVDGAIARGTQAVLGILLVAFAAKTDGMLRPVAVFASVVLLAWVVLARTTFRAYLDLLRRAVTSGRTLDAPIGLDALDLETEESLVEHLGSEDPAVVVGAIEVLARRKHTRLIPALVLLHEDERVIVRALRMFTETKRTDWITRGRLLVQDPREAVRRAAVRALAVAGTLDPNALLNDASPRLRGYAALQDALASSSDITQNEVVREIMERADSVSDETCLGLVEAMGDVAKDARLAPALEKLATRMPRSKTWTEALARAIAAQGVDALIPYLIAQLHERAGRESVYAALVSLGAPAFDALIASTSSPDKSLRLHIPAALERFGTPMAAASILQMIEHDADGQVRYRAIRALGQLASSGDVRVDRRAVERLASSQLAEHFRLLGLRAQFRVEDGPTAALLGGLLDDKVQQSLDRVFRLLKIAHPREDIHVMYLATNSSDKTERADAAEFLDTLLPRREQRVLRDLLRLVADDLTMLERARGGALLLRTSIPTSHEDALTRMTKDSDAAIEALALLHAATADGVPTRVTFGLAQLATPHAHA